MSILFDPFRIKNLEIKNRFVRSATTDFLAHKDGEVSDVQIKFYSDLARGGVGLIITGAADVQREGRISDFCNSIAGDEYIDGLTKLTTAVHDCGAKIALQLYHAGREADVLKTETFIPVAPSIIENDPYFQGKRYREMDESEIWEMIQAFGDAALRAKQAGFDTVQLHGAHATLFAQFLSPFTNLRRDQWGGNLRNRLRFHSEVYNDIRKKVGDDYPVLIKLGVQDGFDGGLEFTEGKEAARILADLGFDALEISQGLRGERYSGREFRTQINRLEKEAYFRNWCKEINNQVNIPTMMVGGLRSFSLMEEIIQNKEADFVSLCRPLMCEPSLINDFKTSQPIKAKCISCNKCLDAMINGGKIWCYIANQE